MGSPVVYRDRSNSYHRPDHFTENSKGTILYNPFFNKGTAFSENERITLGLRGLLPPRVEDIGHQVKRCLKHFRSCGSSLEKHIYMCSLKERNITVFYRLLSENIRELLPIIYTPTVGQACLEFGQQYRAAEGMYFGRRDKGHMKSMLNNWSNNSRNECSIIVVTDGSRILGLGDLGTNGMGIPIGKLSLYVAAGGFHPQTSLPVVLDAGTNNQKLIDDEFYLGTQEKRLDDDAYYDLVDEFLTAVHHTWPHCLVQFEDFSNDHCFELLHRYRKKMLCFNDDIQGTGAVIAAGFLSALKITNLDPTKCRLVFLGAGAAGIGVADQISRALCCKFGISIEDCKKMFYMIDSKGLITSTRGDKLASFKVPYARSDMNGAEFKTLKETLFHVKPHALIGLSGTPNVFTTEIIQFMADINEQPIIFPLSNPTSSAECTAEDAYTITKGKCVFAAGSPFNYVTINGVEHFPSQGNNMYIFPGLGFGAWLGKCREVSDEMITAATLTLADAVSPAALSHGKLYPPLDDVRRVSAAIAAATIKQAAKDGVLGIKLPEDVLSFVEKYMYNPDHLALGSSYITG